MGLFGGVGVMWVCLEGWGWCEFVWRGGCGVGLFGGVGVM